MSTICTRVEEVTSCLDGRVILCTVVLHGEKRFFVPKGTRERTTLPQQNLLPASCVHNNSVSHDYLGQSTWSVVCQKKISEFTKADSLVRRKK